MRHTHKSSPVTSPDLAWMSASLPRILALGLGSGLMRPAPGTWGTLVGWVTWVLLLERLPFAAAGMVILLAFLLGCWLCEHVGTELGVPDHGAMVWDEIVAIWLVLWLVPSGWGMQILAVVLFRLFDI